MQRQSYQVKTVLEKKGARKKTFLAFKDSLGNPLSRSPLVYSLPGKWSDPETEQKVRFSQNHFGRNTHFRVIFDVLTRVSPPSYQSAHLRRVCGSAHVRRSPAAPKRQKERNSSCSRQNKSKASNLFPPSALPETRTIHMQAAERETGRSTGRLTDGQQDERIIPERGGR